MWLVKSSDLAREISIHQSITITAMTITTMTIMSHHCHSPSLTVTLGALFGGLVSLAIPFPEDCDDDEGGDGAADVDVGDGGRRGGSILLVGMVGNLGVVVTCGGDCLW